MIVDVNDLVLIAGAVSAPLGVAWRVLSGLMSEVREEVRGAIDRLDKISDMAAAQIAINAALEHRVTRLERLSDRL